MYKMFSLNDRNIPTDLLTYEILKFVSYFELDDILPCFQLTPHEQALLKFKIYKSRLTVANFSNKTEYTIEGKFHREGDLPAIEQDNGTKEWYVNGKKHRDNDLPAVITSIGKKTWYINGRHIR